VATNVVVSDTLPINTDFSGGAAGCVAAGSIVTCAMGDLAAGASRTLLVKALVDGGVTDGETLTNSVVVSSPTAALPVTAAAVTTATNGTPVDLTVSKQGAVTATAGLPVTYTVVVTNSGVTTATQVTLVDSLPEGVDFIGATATQGSCAGGVVCSLGVLTPGAVVTVAVTGLVAGAVITGAELVDVAQAGSVEPDANPLDNQASFTTTTTALAQLTLVKTADLATATPGATIIYTIAVANAGPSTAQAVVVSDALPVSLTVASISSSAGGCTGFPCALGDVASGTTAWIHIVATVAQTVAGAIDNMASVATITPLATASAPDDSELINVLAAADVAVEKVATATALAGERITYTVVTLNNGPSDAAGVVMTDTLAADVMVAASNGCSVSGNLLTCAVGTLAAGAAFTHTLVVTANSALAAGALVTNQASATGATLDPNPANNSGVAATRVGRAALLAIGKQGSPEPAAAGDTVTYTILVTNSGPSALQAVTVYDLLPAGFSVAGIVADGDGLCLGTGCTFALFPAAATRTITIAAAIAANHAGGVVNNAAHAYAAGVTPVNVSAQTTVNPGPSTTLAVRKFVLNAPAPVGAELLYQIVVTNTGPVDALDVQLQDALPVGVYFAGGDSTCMGAGGQVVCDLGALAPGTVRTVPLRLLVDSTLFSGTQLANSVTVIGTNVPVAVSAWATSTVFIPLGARTQLALAKQAPATVAADGLITYTLLVTNIGPATATNVRLADLLPNDVLFAAVLASQGTCNALVACQLGDLAVGASAVVTVAGRLIGAPQAMGQELTNVAAVHSDNPRPDNRVIQAVFQTSASDIVTTTAPYLILTGSLAGQTANVTSATVGLLQIITFTIEPTFSIVGPGSIRFPLFRPCGASEWLQSTLYTNDYCGLPHVTSDIGGQTIQRPQVVLSLSGGGPVNTRDQSWSFTVRNFGQVAATNVVVTNTLPQGFVYGGFAGGVASVVAGTIGGRDTLTFTIPTVPPLGEVVVNITGTVDSCLASDTMFARLTAGCGVVGIDPDPQYCQGSQIVSVNYTEAEGILLSSNDQSAVIPLCAVGDVTLIVKNVSVEAALYEFFLRQTLTDVTYVPNSAAIKVIRAGAVIVPEQPFTPTSVTPMTPTLPHNQVLIWDSHAMTGYPASLIEALRERTGRDEVILTFQVQTYCSSPNPTVQAAGRAMPVAQPSPVPKTPSRCWSISRPCRPPRRCAMSAKEAPPAALFSPAWATSWSGRLRWQTSAWSMSTA
jgi:uncharacterized repeat protein (TIGR01451 family)